MNIQKKNKLSDYKMEIVQNKLVLKIQGMFYKEDAQNFMDDFIKVTKENNTSNLILLIDASNLNISFPDVKRFYDEMAKIYVNSKFKNKYIIMPESIIAEMQIKKTEYKWVNVIKIISNINQAI